MSERKTTYKLFVTDEYINSIPKNGIKRLEEFCNKFSPVYEKLLLTLDLSNEDLVAIKLQYGDMIIFKAKENEQI